MSIKILAYEETSLGVLCLRQRDVLADPGSTVTEVTLDHEFLMSSRLTDSERALTRRGMERLGIEPRATEPHATELWGPQGKRLEQCGPDGMACNGTEETAQDISVLVGGFGLGYTAMEAVRCEKVGVVEVVEFLPPVIEWFEQGLIPLADELKQYESLMITQGDIYERLAMPPDREFDLIVIDVDHSPVDVLGDQSHGFYQSAGLTRAKSHLKPGGILGVWSYAEDTPLLGEMRKVFDDVEVEQVSAWNDLIDVEQTDWLFYGRRPK